MNTGYILSKNTFSVKVFELSLARFMLLMNSPFDIELLAEDLIQNVIIFYLMQHETLKAEY